MDRLSSEYVPYNHVSNTLTVFTFGIVRPVALVELTEGFEDDFEWIGAALPCPAG